MNNYRERTKMFDGEVIDILMGFTDFQSFKEMMIDVKQVSSFLEKCGKGI